MEEIGKEVHRSLQMEPARFWVREDVYYTYACKKCEEETGEANILKTPKQPVLCPGSFASAEAVAHIMTQKFVMYSPLFVMGRKNWLFANTPAGAQSSAVIYSLIETAKENKLDPHRYLLWVLQSAPVLSQADEFWAEKLLPANAPQECHVPQ